MSIFDELEEIDNEVDALTAGAVANADMLGVLNRNQIAIGKIIFARLDNIDARLRELAALVGEAPTPKAASLNLTLGTPEPNA